MGVVQAMIVAGIGCRRGAPAAAIEAAIDAALARACVAKDALCMVAAPATKAGEAGITAVASALGLPLVLIAQSDLATAGSRTATHSERVLALAGVPSVAEAAALAAGGPNARLVVTRVAIGPATCALAEIEAEP
jgi:cobalt-precorrin 5A hydrolase